MKQWITVRWIWLWWCWNIPNIPSHNQAVARVIQKRKQSKFGLSCRWIKKAENSEMFCLHPFCMFVKKSWGGFLHAWRSHKPLHNTYGRRQRASACCLLLSFIVLRQGCFCATVLTQQPLTLCNTFACRSSLRPTHDFCLYSSFYNCFRHTFAIFLLSASQREIQLDIVLCRFPVETIRINQSFSLARQDPSSRLRS